MADTPESKPSFWSSLPGILTGLGGLILAVTGLITALYTTGMIGPKANSDAVPSVNSSVPLASSPAASPPPNTDNDRYKVLADRKWEIKEKPSLAFPDQPELVMTWRYEATVEGNVLTLRGLLHKINAEDPSELSEQEKRLTSEYVLTLTGSNGEGKFTTDQIDGNTATYPAKISLENNLTRLSGTIDTGDPKKTPKLNGRKL